MLVFVLTFDRRVTSREFVMFMDVFVKSTCHVGPCENYRKMQERVKSISRHILKCAILLYIWEEVDVILNLQVTTSMIIHNQMSIASINILK